MQQVFALSFLALHAVASEEECSCWKGFKPGIGIPGWGSLFCWAPLSCKETCSSQMEDPCSFRALCTLSEGDGKHHCDCSQCKGLTKRHADYLAHCKPDSCPGKVCYWNGCHYDADGGSVCSAGQGLECRANLELPRLNVSTIVV
mmetsp:Transcript_119086/g.186844  ORF Transcript_119086/g.186844 Transcript_119086/m.186844 type:complete len:145 (+) Transcript_119086:64-498(+)